jgi:asparagine synthase (glutamine-hydrolysing)
MENKGDENMCGIAGILSLNGTPVRRSEIEAMCQTMLHRGPDEDGFYLSSEVGLGMRRLRIIDLETGRQPAINEAGTVWAVFNGEIYNYQELRRNLIAKGHTFRTATDTETIVHLYEEYGDRCVEFLRGMFAFALWDERKKRVLLARDRMGIKPLYYGRFRDRLYFASELKALLSLEEIPHEIDWRSAGYLFQFLTTPPESSIIRGIHKLPPAHRMSICQQTGTTELESYWNLQFAPYSQSRESDLVEQLDSLLEESVKLHMISDVPIGAFLSGGVDSSAIVASMSKLASKPVKTFSIGFHDPRYDETPYARTVARAFGTEHHELILEPDEFDVIDKLVWHLDEPFGDTSAIPTYQVAQLASQHVTVVLSGDGGDELFGGYQKYLVEKAERRFDRLPQFIHTMAGAIGSMLPEGARGKRFLTHFGLSGFDRYLDASTLFHAEQRRRLFTADVRQKLAAVDIQHSASDPALAKTGHWLSALQYMDLKHYLPLDILTKVDRMSMAHSIEARVPLLDHKLVEFAATIPPDLQIRDGRTKHLFKSALKGTIGNDILDRPKHGFGVPLSSWFRGSLDNFARDVLLSGRSRQRGVFNTKYVESILDMNSRGRELDFQIWTLISFELWCRTFLDGYPVRTKERSDAYEVSLTGSSGLSGVPDSNARPANVHH